MILKHVTDADWIIEAVVERINIKHDIYKKIFKKEKRLWFHQILQQYLLKFYLKN